MLAPLVFKGQSIEQNIKEGKYLTAWKKIQKKQTLDKQIDFALRYFIQTKNHQYFIFRDLKEGERIGQLRMQRDLKGNDFVFFPIDTLLLEKIANDPNNGVWYQKLGDYYYDVYARYGANWLVNEQELMRLYNSNYKEAIDRGNPSAQAYYARGKFLAFNSELDSAKQFFKKAIEIDKNHAPTAFNLCYLYREEFVYEGGDSALMDSSIYYGKVAVKNYPNAYRQEKSDVAFHLAKSFEVNAQCDSAIRYYLLSDALYPEQVKVMYPLLDCFLAEHRLEGAKVIASKLINLDFKNNRIFNDLANSFGETDHFDALLELLRAESEKDIYNKERSGFFKFYISNVLGFQEKNEKALKILNEAEADFQICYDPGHVIFRVLAKTRDSLKEEITE